jgi:tRNA dimethylallyltransferase
MFSAPFQNALVLTGPTGSGKSVLAVKLAERLGAEIVSMDSMALYRGMDISTAKPAPEFRRRVPHHLIDLLDPWESANVAWWLKQAALCVREIEGRRRRVLFVGGTPLYLKALLHGLFDGPPADPQLRQHLTEQAARLGGAALRIRLAQVDPGTASRLHPNDLRRIIRALEVWELTGKPISAWQTQWSDSGNQGSGVRGQRPGVRSKGSGITGEGDNAACSVTSDPCSLTRDACFQPPVLCLDLPRVELYARINARVKQMVAEGLVEEVQALRCLPRPLSREAAQALGYKEIFELLDGKRSLAETVERIQRRSRNFAKRQLTWFRHLPECRFVVPELTFAAWRLTMGD